MNGVLLFLPVSAADNYECLIAVIDSAQANSRGAIEVCFIRVNNCIWVACVNTWGFGSKMPKQRKYLTFPHIFYKDTLVPATAESFVKGYKLG